MSLNFLIISLCICAIFVNTSGGNRTLDCVSTVSKPIFRSSGDLRLTFIVNECSNSSSLINTITLTSAWICDRLNNLEIFEKLRIGVDIYNSCSVEDLIDPVVDIAKNDEINLGIITWNPVPPKIRALGTVLEIPITVVPKQWRPLVIASVGILKTLHWEENLTVITDYPDVLTLFYHESRKEWICVKSVKSFRDPIINDFTNPTIIFGNGDEITNFLKKVPQTIFNNKLIVVPLDGSQIEVLPDGAYIFQPLLADSHQKLSNSRQIIPSPILLNIAVPLINIADNLSLILEKECYNESNYISCLKKQEHDFKSHRFMIEMNQQEILKYLKITPLFDKFVYNIFKVEDLGALIENVSDILGVQSFVKVGAYSIFNYSLEFEDKYVFNESNSNFTEENCFTNHRLCIFQCMNFRTIVSDSENEYLIYNVVLKQDPWILAVLSIASLGVVFCLAILIFIFVRIFKKDIFEGNPVLSVLLLLTLTVMYASVVPFALEVTFEAEFRSSLSDYLCLIRSLIVTLSYSCAFSLMLSRCIMLATVAYEAGFMSHITGHVQSLLCLFMIAVQGALSLQSVENCQDLFSTNSFLYTLSYNFLLLGLLFISCPFIYRSQRNYKEGWYFAISIVLIMVVWITWLTAYLLVNDKWKSVVICGGLLGTASSILGAVFIPRTYLMTSAVVRDSLTSALPSLAFASSTSVLDLNYTNAQHVYDCVNIATINSTMSQVLPPVTPQCNPNFYSDEPGLETTEIQTNSPTCDSPDKSFLNNRSKCWDCEKNKIKCNERSEIKKV